MMNAEVTILLATYNGGKYLSELLDSILNQTHQNWKLLVRDDGSSDNTCEILSEYIKKDSRITMINSNERLGSCGNFTRLIENSDDAEYLMFCDQDDVWEKDKIKKTLDRMQEKENEEGNRSCQLVFCGMKIVDEKLKEIPNATTTKTPGISLWDILIQNPVYGCTMMINRALAHNAGIPRSYVQIHDYYYALFAALFGHITYIDEPLIKYRQHSSNVTGGANNFNIGRKIMNIRKINSKLHKTFFQNYSFCKEYSNTNSDIARKYIMIFDCKPLKRCVYAYKEGLRLKGILQNLRYYLAIYTYKGL